MKCPACGEEMASLGHVNLQDGVEIRFDECEKHGIQAGRFSGARPYEALATVDRVEDLERSVEDLTSGLAALAEKPKKRGRRKR